MAAILSREELVNLPLKKMAAISQTIFSDAFSFEWIDYLYNMNS